MSVKHVSVITVHGRIDAAEFLLDGVRKAARSLSPDLAVLVGEHVEAIARAFKLEHERLITAECGAEALAATTAILKRFARPAPP